MDKNIFLGIVIFNLISVIVISISMFGYVAYNDYVAYNLYNTALSLRDDGLITQNIVDLGEDALNTPRQILDYLDLLWIFAFVLLCIEVFTASYNMKRESYFSIFSFLTYGVIIILFIVSIIVNLSEWFYDLFITDLLMGFSLNMPFFTWYLNNTGLVTALIIVICIILNYVDFGFMKFYNEKTQGDFNDEIG